MATKSIRWTAWILVLAGLAAVILTWLSDESPGYANHDSFSIVHITKVDPAEGSDGRVKVDFNRPVRKGEVFLLKYIITAGNGASQSDLRNPLNQETTVKLSGWTTPNTRTIRIPIQTIQDQEPEPDETIRVELTRLALQAKVKELSGEWVSHNKDFGQRTYDLSIIDDDARPSTPGNLQAVPSARTASNSPGTPATAARSTARARPRAMCTRSTATGDHTGEQSPAAMSHPIS